MQSMLSHQPGQSFQATETSNKLLRKNPKDAWQVTSREGRVIFVDANLQGDAPITDAGQRLLPSSRDAAQIMCAEITVACVALH